MPNMILDPTTSASRGAAAAPAWQPAQRIASLRGARVGLLINTKKNAAAFLTEVGKLLEQQGAVTTLTRTKTTFAQPAPEDMVKELVTECDFVITGIGDCGSCSASAVTDGIELESRGLPTAVICSDAFGASADAIAALRGAPGYRYLTTPHPVAVLTPEQVRERAGQLIPGLAALLTGEDSSS